ncbi:hypothetical protein WICPIJ_004522 [Wickerhamomyces pijperi]|uniref:Uncharacterized protein n=1 Tax=Wickerhamomyces pijperi TaxID=599730 RepID=A0A9P8TLZ2_WICPI|nr:hypothetical protein WICPIJ_004522 [Wickerhamomyces pijperi]
MTPEPTRHSVDSPNSSADCLDNGPTTSPADNQVPPKSGEPPNLLKLSSTNSGNCTFSRNSFDQPCTEPSTPGGTKPCLQVVEQ